MAIERDPVLTMSGDGRVEMHHEAELWLRMAREFLSLAGAVSEVKTADALRAAGTIALQHACESVNPPPSLVAGETWRHGRCKGSPQIAAAAVAEMLRRWGPVGDAGYDVEVRVTWRPVSTGKAGG